MLLWIGIAAPANAAVTVTFWSHELGNSFPHAFFTLRGTPEAGGDPVDLAYGFTARTLSPAILWGTVAGRLETVKPGYIHGSDAQFSLALTDRQYAELLALARAWGDEGGDSRYDLNRRNCVHFVQEAARRLGLAGLEQPRLMKKPRSYLKAVAAANPGHVIALDLPGKAYLATLPPLMPRSTPRPSTGSRR